MPVATVYRPAHTYMCDACGKPIKEGELYIAVRDRSTVKRYHVRCMPDIAMLMLKHCSRTIYIHRDGSTKPSIEPLIPGWEKELEEMLRGA
jgi:hypothetical protein